MNIIILTSSDKGTASHHLEYLASNNFDIKFVLYSKSKTVKSFKSKLKKIKKIGLFGAINGLRMRKWYNSDLYSLKKISSLKNVCDQYGIDLIETDKINSKKTIKLLSKYNIDIGVSLGNGYISKNVFDIPTKGFINIHHEILPDYQNAQSIIWQLYNGSKQTGYTIHRINNKIDEGEILYKEKVPIIFKPSFSGTITVTYGELLDRSAVGLHHVLQDFNYYEENSQPQGIGNKYTTPSMKQFLCMYLNYKKLISEERER